MEYFVNFEVIQKNASRLIPAGHVVAVEQYKLPISIPRQEFTDKTGKTELKISTSDNTIAVHSSRVNFVFDRKQGVVTSYKVNGQEYFEKDSHPAQLLESSKRQ